MKKTSKKGFQQVYCYMCKPQVAFNKVEQLMAHMKEEHQGVLWPEKKA